MILLFFASFVSLPPVFPAHLVSVASSSSSRISGLWRRCRPGCCCTALAFCRGFSVSGAWWVCGRVAPAPVASAGSNRWRWPLPCLPPLLLLLLRVSSLTLHPSPLHRTYLAVSPLCLYLLTRVREMRRGREAKRRKTTPFSKKAVVKEPWFFFYVWRAPVRHVSPVCAATVSTSSSSHRGPLSSDPNTTRGKITSPPFFFFFFKSLKRCAYCRSSYTARPAARLALCAPLQLRKSGAAHTRLERKRGGLASTQRKRSVGLCLSLALIQTQQQPFQVLPVGHGNG